MQFFVTSESGPNVQPDASAAGGWVIQKLQIDYDITDCESGQPANPSRNPWIYYEAFPVGSDGMVPVSPDSMDNWDAWNFVSRPRTRGTVRAQGWAYYHESLGDDEMPEGGVPNAGDIRSSFDPPAGLGQHTLYREMRTEWNCCVDPEGGTTGEAAAKNRWDTYEESWYPGGEGSKVVDGTRIH